MQDLASDAKASAEQRLAAVQLALRELTANAISEQARAQLNGQLH